MSEKEKIELFDKIREGIREAQVRMLQRKAKLGESVVVADADGNPQIIPAQEALQRREK